MDRDLTDRLLDSDPALRWQVERALLGAPEEVWAATHARVAAEGFRARLLALQDPDGQWAGGAYFPGDFYFGGPEAAEGAGQPWTATTWSLNALREEAIEAIRAERQPDGTRLQAQRHPGRVWFEVDVPAGEPSKWLTLSGTRVLDWWDALQAAAVTP